MSPGGESYWVCCLKPSCNNRTRILLWVCCLKPSCNNSWTRILPHVHYLKPSRTSTCRKLSRTFPVCRLTDPEGTPGRWSWTWQVQTTAAPGSIPWRLAIHVIKWSVVTWSKNSVVTWPSFSGHMIQELWSHDPASVVTWSKWSAATRSIYKSCETILQTLIYCFYSYMQL